MPNRVAELESSVAQLRATVDGLQEELVDAHERIRALERELEDEESTTDADSPDPVVFPPEPSDEQSNSESTANEVDDIIVA